MLLYIRMGGFLDWGGGLQVAFNNKMHVLVVHHLLQCNIRAFLKEICPLKILRYS